MNKKLIRLLKYLIIIVLLFNILILFRYNKTNNHLPKFTPNLNTFERILDEFCDPSSLTNSYSCLAKVNEYEKNLTRSKHKCSPCLVYSKESQRYEKKFIYHHTFWQINQNNFVEAYQKRVLFLNLMSYLATQNLCCTKFIFWKLKQFPKTLENQIRDRFKTFFHTGVIKMKDFDLSDVCKTKAFDNHSLCLNENTYLEQNFNERNLIELSDFVRFFALDQFGGIYTDGDVIYLRDMQSLWDFNFAYRWGKIDYFNTAIIGMSKTENSSDLYGSIVSSWKTLNDLIFRFEPHEITVSVKKLNNGSMYNYKYLKMLHSALFDSAWLCHENAIGILNLNSMCSFSDFAGKEFQNIRRDNFSPDIIFPGAFALHLHLKDCCRVIVKNSFMELLENYWNYIK